MSDSAPTTSGLGSSPRLQDDAAPAAAAAGRLSANPLLEMLAIAAPTVVTMTSYTLMQFVDGLMVSRIRPPDEVYVSAQGNGGVLVWLLMSFVFGVTSVVNTFVSQNLGAGKPERGAAYAWNGLWICALLAALILPLYFAVPWIFSGFNHPAQLVALESSYAQTMILGGFFIMGARTIAQYFFGMHRPVVVMFAVISANLVNLCCNAVFVYGPAGGPEAMPLAGVFQEIARSLHIPAMGVRGAALGTVIGSIVEFSIPMVVFLFPMHRRFGTRSGGAWRPARRPIRDIIRLGWPGGLMASNEMLCWSYLMAVLLRAAGEAAHQDGVVHNTAGWIALRYMHLAFMPAIGISIAVSATVGRCMGMRRPDMAAHRAWLGLGLTLGYMGLCALGFVIFRERLVLQFVPDGMSPEHVKELLTVGSGVMIIAAIFQLFDATAITMSGALRGAGDTVWPGVYCAVLSWICIIGLGHLMIRLAPGLGSWGPWSAAALYIILVGAGLLFRFIRGRWRTIRLVE
jgi:MATE family multidrug resistance protein